MLKSIAILIFTVAAMEAMASSKVGVSCKNVNGEFSISKKVAVLSQKKLKGNDALKELIKKDFAMEVEIEDLQVDFEARIPAKDLTCQKTTGLLVDCQGRSKKAEVTLTASYMQVGGQGQMQFTRRMNLNNVIIDSSLVNEGPISIGAGTTTVELNQLKVSTDLDIVIGDQSAPVKLTPSFNTQTDCKK